MYFKQTQQQVDGCEKMEVQENVVGDLSQKHTFFYECDNDFFPKKNDCEQFFLLIYKKIELYFLYCK